MSKQPPDFMSAFFLDTKHLVRRLTTTEAESVFSLRLKDHGPDPIPFGFLNPEWNQLKAKMRKGDELWEFEHTWGRGDHDRGVKLLRNGKAIDTVVGSSRPARDGAKNTPLRRITQKQARASKSNAKKSL